MKKPLTLLDFFNIIWYGVSSYENMKSEKNLQEDFVYENDIPAEKEIS